MGNGIFKKRILAIGKEITFGVPVAPSYYLPLLDVPRFVIDQRKERDIAPAGSSYIADDLQNTDRMAQVSFPVKVDEDTLPLFFVQKFTDTPVLVSGETGVYTHTMAYSTSNTGSSYTLYLQDGDRTTEYMAGVRFGSLNVTIERGFVKLDCEGVGIFPTTWTGTNSVTVAKTFMGKHAVFNFGAYSGAKAPVSILSATVNHNFNLTGDETNFALGSADPVYIYTTEDEFTTEIKSLMPDYTIRAYFAGATATKHDITITDTSRYVATSTTNVNPSIKFDFAISQIEKWAEDGGLADIGRQNYTLLALNKAGVSNAPEVITVVNNVASY